MPLGCNIYDNDRLADGQSHFILRLVGFAAATVFLLVSALANLRFGLSLGNTELDRAIYAVASVASDLLKAVLPILALLLWCRRHRMTALAAIILWTGCVGWSLASAIGFAATSREDVVAVRQANVETRHGWQATVRRSEEKLTSLERARPPNVILAEINKLAVPANIWRRTRKCTDVTVETSRLACAKIQSLRTELASARAAEKLEKRLEATRAKLDTAPVSGSKTDPQAAAIAGLFSIDEDTVRNGLALLIAILVEAGSALGFTITILATSGSNGARQSEAVELAPATSRRKPIWKIPTDAPTPIEVWAAHRLDIAPGEVIPAMAAYEDFATWCRDQEISPWTMTKFGREFKVLVRDIGGDKQKRRDRRYYTGVALNTETRKLAPAELEETDVSPSQSRTRACVMGS